VGGPLNLSTFDGFIFSQGNSHENETRKAERVYAMSYMCVILKALEGAIYD